MRVKDSAAAQHEKQGAETDIDILKNKQITMKR